MNEYSDYPELEQQRKFYSIDSEQNIIGTILLAPEKLIEAVSLKPMSMYDSRHKMIIEACLELSNDNKPIDAIIIAEYFDERAQLDKVGGLDYLLEIAKNTASTSNINSHIRIVNSYAKERSILEAARKMVEAINQPDISTDERIAEVHKIFDDSTADNDELKTTVSISPALKEYIEFLDWRFNNNEQYGILTGIKEVDERLQGLKGGELYVVAGRPGSGKSTYMTNILLNTAAMGSKCYVKSIEMPRKQLMQRMLACVSSITMNSLKDASALGDHSAEIVVGVSKIKKMQIEINDDGTCDIADLANECRMLNKTKGLDIILVDYLQLMQDRTVKDNKRLEIGGITRKLKALSKELDVPIVLLSQCSRKCEDRNDKRPWISDLAESGDIEANADVIQFVYRDEYYSEDTHAKGVVEIITRKFRDGESGTDYCNFVGSKNQIKDLDYTYTPPAPEQKQYKSKGF